MQIQSAFSAGVQGLQNAQNGLMQATVEVAKPTENQQAQSGVEAPQTTDKTGAIVSALASERQGEASANVISRVNETIGSIIDIEV
ncbi:chemotaxis protein [Shewanella sp. C32]|uniref:Chemotaxis protein n=1 Tax=Shewanella electrica TaxID=515560 RepID=A0ABT2FL87_9GAMM|nr:chemotaxis protein [Shewanella electrica]MCH1923815.1 chemotaxis protein [Shewanella electrica]MCS4557033.1 chemotaxis protein [Shewanella electrica]